MTGIIRHLFVLLILFPFAGIGQSGSVKGRIFNSNTNEPIPFANIIVTNTNIGTTSDLDGNFTFTGLEPGFIRLTATAVGFQNKLTEEIKVTNAATAFLDIPMTPSQVELEAVVVRVSPFERDNQSPVSIRSLGVSEIEKNPGSNRDISRVIQNLPGVASSVSYRNDVIVRGGGPSENKFYLEDIEIPTINHFATQGASGGPVGIINADFLREVDLYSGAFPANRGNALSSVLEMKMKNGNAEKTIVRGTLGASDLALTVEGPIGKKSTYIVSARRSYLQFLFGVIGLPFLPTYNDFQLKNRIILDEKNTLTFIGLGAIDDFELNTGLKNPTEDQQFILSFVPVNKQKTYTAGAVYKHFGNTGNHTFVLSRNYLDNQSYKYKDNDESTEANKILDYKSIEAENKFRYEHDMNKSGIRINYGGGLEYATYSNQTFSLTFDDSGATSINYNSDIDLWSWSLFAQVTKGFFSERLSLSLGARTDANDYAASMSNMLEQISPRFSASYVLSDGWFLNFNTGRYFQRPPLTTFGFENNQGILVNKENDLKYIRSDHIVGGVEYRPDEESQITLEGFYKLYDNYPFSLTDSISIASKGGDFGTYGDEAVISQSKGQAYGFEVFARGMLFGKINTILSYTFVRSETEDKNGNYIPSAWDNRHILNVSARRSFKRNWDVGARWRFVGGAPYTPWDLNRSSYVQAWDARGRGYLNFDRFNSLRLGSFHQLDLRVDKSYFFNRWSMTFYLDVQNVYNFKGEEPDNLIRVTDANGNPVIINPSAPPDQQRYELKQIKSEAGTVLPTLGVIIEFSL